MDQPGDWRDDLLVEVPLPDPVLGGRNPIGWVGYEPRQAVRYGEGRVAGHDVVACVWDFATYGGSLGEREAATVAAAAARAAQVRVPLVTFVRTGGTRMQEGMAALVGIARTAIALYDLADAGVPHVSVADQPTTGGVWVGIVSGADLRLGVSGATVGFSGPRVIEAMTGERPPAGSHTAESAFRAGLLDAVAAPAEVERWLRGALTALAPQPPTTTARGAADVDVPRRSGLDQVHRARDPRRIDGAGLLDALLDGPVALHGADETVHAAVGRSAAGRGTVGVALAAQRGVRPTPAGYALLARAAELAHRLRLDLLTLVDTPGADPRAPSEDAGIAPAIRTALATVYGCRSPSLAVVHGEGGSGGALAASTTDVVLVTGDAYFTALAPEGAGAALHSSTEAAAERMALTPPQLRELGFADGYAPSDPSGLRATVANSLVTLAALDESVRIATRRTRWSGPLPGRSPAEGESTPRHP